MEMARLLRVRTFLIGLLLALVISLVWFLFVPPSGTAVKKVIYVKKGALLKTVSATLEKEGIIRSKHLFVVVTTLLGKRMEIKAGEYELHTAMSPLQVLNALVKGQVRDHLVTIPEGYTLSQIGQHLQDLNIVEKTDFLQKAMSPTFIASLDLGPDVRPTLEGYLFPDTYHFYREMNPEEVIRRMVQQFKKVFTPELSFQAAQQGMSEREVVILASIIEKETSLPEEKPLVSAVFHNRLRLKMPLQSDPTVIYGLKDFNGNLKKEHLTRPSPYNTYLLSGLPPGPICNPGRSSLLAALSPASIPYLYFVSKGDGSHHFSTTLAEHNRAVIKYQVKNRLTKE
jgi:UPF0755 protein